MPVAQIIDLLALLQPAIELGIVIVLVVKKLWRRFPAFTAYAVLHVAKLPTEFFLRHQHGSAYYTAYFFVYWSTEVISAVLTYAIVYELYDQVFRRYEGLSRLGRLLLNWVAAILVLIGAVASAMTSGNDYTRLVTGMMTAHHFHEILRLGLVPFLFMIPSSLR